MEYNDYFLFKKSNKFLLDFEKLVSNNPYQNPYHENYICNDDYREKLWFSCSEDYVFSANEEFSGLLSSEIKELNEQNSFFRFCKFSTYKSYFNQRFKDFQKEFDDAELIDFIEVEGLVYVNSFNNHKLFAHANKTDVFRLNLAQNKTLEFLNKKANEIGFTTVVLEKNFICTKNEEQPFKIDYKNGIKWHSTKRDLIELAEVLIENESLKGERKEIYAKLGGFFNEDLKNHTSELSTMLAERKKGKIKFVNKFTEVLTKRIENLDANKKNIVPRE
tara:strand:- start:2115 stop:2942 length:828 start_codon:yes stop_codon:yes gene_type:complete